jgi:hypothetical protein
MWFLEFANDQILGLDAPRQHVPPRVRYGIDYLLIRNTIGCVSSLVEWGNDMVFCLGPHGARGVFVENP